MARDLMQASGRRHFVQTEAERHALKPTVDLQIERWSTRSCVPGMVRGLSSHGCSGPVAMHVADVAGVGAGAPSHRHEPARGGRMLPAGGSCGPSFRS